MREVRSGDLTIRFFEGRDIAPWVEIEDEADIEARPLRLSSEQARWMLHTGLPAVLPPIPSARG